MNISSKSVLFPSVALILGLGVGFGVAKFGGSGEDAAIAAEREMRNGRTGGRGSEREDAAASKKGASSVDEIYGMPGTSNRIQALLDFYSNLSPDEFSSEAKKLNNLPLNEQILVASLLFGKWAEVDPTAAMAFTDTMGLTGTLVRPAVLQSWASTDPVNAAKFYAENSAQFAMMDMLVAGGGEQLGVLGAGQTVASEWAKQDPKAAMEWAAGLKGNSEQAMSAVVSEVAKTDPKKAAEMASKLDATSRAKANEGIAKQWGAKNFSEAQKWVNSLPENQRDGAMSSAIKGLAQTSPLVAANEISKAKNPKALSSAVPTVAKNYAQEDMKGSMKWLNTIKDDQAKKNSMIQVMPIYAKKDSKAAIGFISNQTSPAVKDRAAQGYLFGADTAPVQDQLQVLEMIGPDGNKAEATAIVAARWMQQDKPAATKYINGNPLIPNDVKGGLINGSYLNPGEFLGDPGF